MITDKQFQVLKKLNNQGRKLKVMAMKTDMCEKTARKYLGQNELPSQSKLERHWRTREDVFQSVWPDVEAMLKAAPSLEAKTIFEELQRNHPNKFYDGQLRSLQRRVKVWKTLNGEPNEVFFPQTHYPGRLCESDFTSMSKLDITIEQQPFDHLIYHFVLTYSNWETGTVCYSESYESLSQGLQSALWNLGGVPEIHKTDRLSAAVNNLNEKREFTQRYNGLLNHYGLTGHKNQAGRGNENGDVEQRHYRFKRALDQALLLRGSRDFESRKAYELFLQTMFDRLNKGRQKKVSEEMKHLKSLPSQQLDDRKVLEVSVRNSSTIRVLNNTYSVPSRLIGETIKAQVGSDFIEVWCHQQCVEQLPRLRGTGKHKINYHHIIDELVRKPGAFANYKYRCDLFPSSRFRMAYDMIQTQFPTRADKEYLKVLQLASREGESTVERILDQLISEKQRIQAEVIQTLLGDNDSNGPDLPEAHIPVVDLMSYDVLLQPEVVAV